MILAVLVPSLIGFFALNLIFSHMTVWRRLTLGIALGPVLGLSLCSLLLFFMYLINPGWAHNALMWIPLVVCILLGQQASQQSLFRSIPKPRFLTSEYWEEAKRDRVSLFIAIFNVAAVILFTYAILRFFYMYGGLVVSNFYGGWDARYIWLVKAKFFFREPELWQSMFAGEMSWTHPDYPLLFPGMLAWGWNWLGAEFAIWSGVVSFIIALGCLCMVAWALSDAPVPGFGFLAAAFMASMDYFSLNAVEQYADVPLCFFFLTTCVFLIRALKYDSWQDFLLAGFLAGCSAWTKNEGLFFCGWSILMLLVYVKFVKKTPLIKFMKPFVLGLLVPLGFFLIQKVFFTPEGEYWGAGHGLSDYVLMLFADFETTKTILIGFFKHCFIGLYWNYLWFFFLGAIAFLFLFKKKLFRQPDYWVPFTLALLVLLGYFMVLHVSPMQIKVQLNTALSRLLLQVSGIAILLVFQVFSSTRSDWEDAPVQQS